MNNKISKIGLIVIVILVFIICFLFFVKFPIINLSNIFAKNISEEQDFDTQLYDAITSNNINELQILLTKTADINHKICKKNECIEPLEFAIDTDNITMMNLFIEYGFESKEALYYALRSNKVRIVEFLLNKGIKFDNNEILALVLPWNSESLKVLTKYVDNDLLNQLLFKISVHNCDKELIQYYIDKGADVNATAGENQESILMFATGPFTNVACNTHNAVEILVRNGANVNYRDKNGRTVIMLAAAQDSFLAKSRTVDFFLEHGADINAIDNDGKTVLIYSTMYGIRDYLIKDLIQKGADAKIIEEQNALGIAIALNDIKLVDTITNKITNKELNMAQGFDVYDTPITPLEYALFHKKYDIAKLLIEKGADVNAKDYLGDSTVLMCAIYSNDENAVKILIDNGADINATDKEGNTVLEIARKSGDEKMIKLIESEISKSNKKN